MVLLWWWWWWWLDEAVIVGGGGMGGVSGCVIYGDGMCLCVWVCGGGGGGSFTVGDGTEHFSRHRWGVESSHRNTNTTPLGSNGTPTAGEAAFTASQSRPLDWFKV